MKKHLNNRKPCFSDQTSIAENMGHKNIQGMTSTSEVRVAQQRTKRIPFLIWIVFGLFVMAGLAWATTTVRDDKIQTTGIVNLSNLLYGNTSGTYNETMAGREFTTNYQKRLTVCSAGCDSTTIQGAINQVPLMLRHNWTIQVTEDGTYAEDLYFPPMITQRRHPTEGSVAGLELKGNTANINGVKVKSIQTSGIIGSNGLSIDYFQIYGQDPTSDELASVTVYGSNKVILHHINFTNASANYAVMAYSSSLEVHSSYFNNMAYAGLAKVQANLRLGDNYLGSGNNGTLTTAIAKADDASIVYIESTNLEAPIIADGSGIVTYGTNEKPNLLLNGGSVTLKNGTAPTVIRDINISTRAIEFHRGEIASFISNNNNPYIYATGQGGSYPFSVTGNLVIQPRTSATTTDIIFAVGGAGGNPVIPMTIKGTTQRVTFGNGTEHKNFTMVSPNGTNFNCGVNNSGFFSCS